MQTYSMSFSTILLPSIEIFTFEIVYKKMYLIYCSNMTPYPEQHLKLFQAAAWHQNFQDSNVLLFHLSHKLPASWYL